MNSHYVRLLSCLYLQPGLSHIHLRQPRRVVIALLPIERMILVLSVDDSDFSRAHEQLEGVVAVVEGLAVVAGRVHALAQEPLHRGPEPLGQDAFDGFDALEGRLLKKRNYHIRLKNPFVYQLIEHAQGR